MRIYPFLASLVCAISLSQTAQASNRVRITAIAVIDNGAAENSSPIPLVDTLQGECGTIEDPSPEPFYDSVASIEVVNTSRTTIRFKRFSYRFAENGTWFNSDVLAPGNFFEVPPGGSRTLVASLFTQIKNGRKYFAGSPDPIAVFAGPKSIQFILTGKNGRKKRVTVNATTTVSFADYNRCSAQ